MLCPDFHSLTPENAVLPSPPFWTVSLFDIPRFCITVRTLEISVIFQCSPEESTQSTPLNKGAGDWLLPVEFIEKKDGLHEKLTHCN